LCQIVQKIEYYKKKTSENVQIKSENFKKKNLTLLVGFCSMVVAPKTTYKKKIRWKEYQLRKHKQQQANKE